MRYKHKSYKERYKEIDMENIGVKDYIDCLLVKKYVIEKVDNREIITSMVSIEKFMAAYKNVIFSLVKTGEKNEI